MKRWFPWAVATLLLAPLPAGADPTPTAVVSAAGVQYVPKDMDITVQQGTTVLFVNLDPIAPHTLSSVYEDPDGVRLFETGGGRSTQPGQYSYVDGVERLPLGRYEFQCLVHSQAMRGWLNVVPRPG